jgi:hypothetical protein
MAVMRSIGRPMPAWGRSASFLSFMISRLL